MSGELLAPGDVITAERTRQPCTIVDFLGGGGQGEVYRAELRAGEVAVKWYYPSPSAASQRGDLEKLLARPAPSRVFLWPLDLVTSGRVPGFGYVMPLAHEPYQTLSALLRREVDLELSTLASLGMNLADAFLRLHSDGLCYKDISAKNVFFHRESGEILVCDNDNVAVDGETFGGVLGTPRFMAPEIVRREALPSKSTDLWSLSVLLFYVLCLHHPLEGARELRHESLSDADVVRDMYGERPVFIFDPGDESNRPVPGLHQVAIDLWPFYPPFVRQLFVQAFTEGIREPLHGRVRESEWRSAMARLHDLVTHCEGCGADSYVDPDSPDGGLTGVAPGVSRACWRCGAPLKMAWLELSSGTTVVLRPGGQLHPHQLKPGRLYDFSRTLAAVHTHPSDPGRFGLKNESDDTWIASTATGKKVEVAVGATVGCNAGMTIDFGGVKGQVVVAAR